MTLLEWASRSRKSADLAYFEIMYVPGRLSTRLPEYTLYYVNSLKNRPYDLTSHNSFPQNM